MSMLMGFSQIKPTIQPVQVSPNDAVADYPESYKDKLIAFSGYTRKYDDALVSSDWAHLKNSQLLEYTPLGNVLMYYDASKDTFVYYSDRVLSYPYMDTVARRYVTTYNCTKLYLDVNSPDSRSITESSVSLSQNPNTINTPKKSEVFASFKKYNTPKTMPVRQFHQKINRYTYGGKLANFMFLKKPPSRATMSYAEFKTKYKVSSK